MWLMVGVAVVILAIILFTGHPQPLPRPRPARGRRSRRSCLRIASAAIEQQLAADEAREQQALPAIRRRRPRRRRPTGSAPARGGDPIDRRPAPPRVSESLRRQRRAQPASCRPAAVRRAPATRGAGVIGHASRSPDVSALEQLLARASTAIRRRRDRARRRRAAGDDAGRTAGGSAAASAMRTAIDRRRRRRDGARSSPVGGIQRLLEGTVIETVLLNRLDGHVRRTRRLPGDDAGLFARPAVRRDSRGRPRAGRRRAGAERGAILGWP